MNGTTTQFRTAQRSPWLRVPHGGRLVTAFSPKPRVSFWRSRIMRVSIQPGDRYGRFVVVEEVEPVLWRTKRIRRAKCKCDCGSVKTVRLGHLRSGSSTSCGCSRDGKFTTLEHGLYATATYISWRCMVRRCHESGSAGYRNYGGRGIKVCDRWRQSFSAFVKDMGERPDGCSLDRIDNSGDYEPGNCRWSTREIQHRNMRSNHWITVGDETLCLSDWARRLGTLPSTICLRLSAGWPEVDAVTKPVRKRGGRHA